MGIREDTTSKKLNEKVRTLMIEFWDAYDKLFIDMYNLTEDEFFKRAHKMYQFRNKASEIDGDYFLISLWGMSEKARKLYGEGSSKRYIDFLDSK